MKKKNVSAIGGQAVLEGVMMRGKTSMATAVRRQDGQIAIESSRLNQSESRKKAAKIPVVRGIVSFFESFVSGLKTTMRSSEVYGDMSEETPTKFEKWLAKTFKIDIMNVILAVGVILGVIFSVALFVILPQVAALGIFSAAGILKVDFANGVWDAFQTSTNGLGFGWNMLYEVIRGIVRIGVFISYIALISLMKDIKRLFMYHGAEHKVISCFESGLELNVENARKMSTRHDRCGTTFIFIVMIFSMLFFTVVPVSMIKVGNGAVTFLVQLAVRLALIPVVAGISYELLKLYARYDNIFTRIGKAPGLWLQKLTTRQPDDSMLEVSLAAFTEVMKLEADASYPTKTFVTYTTVEKAVSVVAATLSDEKKDSDAAKNEAELIIMRVTGANKKSDLYDGRRITAEQFKQCKKYAENRLTGAPLQYVLGTAAFYGLDFDSDTRALIPRFDTEILVEQALKIIKTMSDEPSVLDLGTGSGCIAVAIKKNAKNCSVTASDVSIEALGLAKQNAQRLNADITFEKGSLFMPFTKKKFDVIVSNPPYIPSGDIAGLDGEVRDYEPRLALDGGPDGLDYYRDICGSAAKHLNNNGYLLLEVGVNEADRVKGLLGGGFETATVEDYNTPPVERVVIAKFIAGGSAEDADGADKQ